MDYVLYFFAYSFLGWVCECLYCGIPARRFINRGFLEGPYCPIYGWGALIVIFALTPLRDYPPLLFLGAMIFTSVLEYVTSWLMEKLFHSKWWDYSERPFNLNGRICLLNSFLFGVMGLVVMYVVHPFICDVFEQIPALARLITAAVLLSHPAGKQRLSHDGGQFEGAGIAVQGLSALFSGRTAQCPHSGHP